MVMTSGSRSSRSVMLVGVYSVPCFGCLFGSVCRHRALLRRIDVAVTVDVIFTASVCELLCGLLGLLLALTAA